MGRAIRVKAFWFQKEVGKQGYFGAILKDGSPINYCSYEKFSFMSKNSIRTRLTETIEKGIHIYKNFKNTYYSGLTEEDFKREKLIEGLKIPNELINLIKK